MRLYKYYLVFFTLSILSFSSCGKKIAPSETRDKAIDTFDTAAYNEIYVEAIKQKLLGNGGDALNYFEKCLKINPESDAAWYQMAQIVIANGDLNSGKKYASKALSFDKDNIWYLTMLAGLYYQQKNLDSAIVCYSRAVKLFPEKEDLQLTLGNLYSEDKRYEEANTIFENFDKKYGVNEKSTLSAIKNRMAQGNFDDALIKAESLIKEFPDEILYSGILADIYQEKGENEKALEVYNNLLEKSPDNPQIQLALCNFLITQKNYNDLFLFLNRVLLNNNVDRESKISLLAHIIELPDLNKESQDKLAISLLVLEANYSNDNIIPLLRTDLLIRENKLDDAAKRLEELVKSNPDNYYAWEKLLFVYLQIKDYNKLFTKGEECATRFNTSFTVKLLYANAALETGKYTIAIDELKKAEILAGNNKDSLSQVLTMRADVYYRMKDYPKSFETFEMALKNNENDLTVINNYAYYLAQQNAKLKEAEEMAKKATELDKGNTTFLDTYGWVLYKRGKLQEAAKVFESIIKSGDKPDAVWYEHYGYILKKEKKCSEAITNWNTALKLDSTKTELIQEIENCGK